MDYSHRLAISYYKTITVINEEHRVFLVQHLETHKICLKKILTVYNIAIYSYLKEHPVSGVPDIIELDEENGELTVIEEYISGTSLQDILLKGALPIETAVHYVCELCDILGQLHSMNPPIVHRDIKPSNIILTPCNHVFLVDFNAAKYLTDIKREDTMLLGTRGYAAPEQYGFGSSTPQTDIYALGILLKELTDSSSALPHRITAIIEKCTMMVPAERFHSVFELKHQLEKATDVPVYSTVSAKTTSWRSFLPPGYRTLSFGKMLTATIMYPFIFWLCLSLTVSNTGPISLWFQRICCLFMALTVVFISWNYRNIQRFFPLCRNENPFLHYLGILLFDILTVFCIFLLMVIILSILPV